MVRVIIERHVKPDMREELMTLLGEIRSACVKQRGYASGETLFDPYDPSAVVVISSWGSLSSWKIWEQSEERLRVYDKIRPLLTEEPRVRIYLVAATERATS
jgi:quinol monooxygenase YgiN